MYSSISPCAANTHFLGVPRIVDDLRSVGLPAGRSTGCVIKPAARSLINESDEWHASDGDDDDPTLEIEISRERNESYDLDV